jgi:hypothetical protein
LTLAQRVAATNSDLGYSVGYESVWRPYHLVLNFYIF